MRNVPLLYSVYNETLINKDTGIITINGKTINNIRFANVTVLIIDCLNDPQELLENKPILQVMLTKTNC